MADALEYGEAELRDKLVETGVPAHIRNGLIEYIVRRRMPGGFLTAVLENNLTQACFRADALNIHSLRPIVGFLYNYSPGVCWGSPDKVKAWVAQGLVGETNIVRAFDPEQGDRIIP